VWFRETHRRKGFVCRRDYILEGLRCEDEGFELEGILVDIYTVE